MAINCNDSSYTIRKVDTNTSEITVNKGEINQTSVDLTLLGKRRREYGETFNENLLKLLENFSSPEDATNPGNPDPANTSGGVLANPTAGQVWHNSTADRLYQFTGAAWVALEELGDVAGNSGIISSGQQLPRPVSSYTGYVFPYEECSWIVSPRSFGTEPIEYMLCVTDDQANVTFEYLVEGMSDVRTSLVNYQIIGIRDNANLGIQVSPGPRPSPTPTPTPSSSTGLTATPTPTPSVGASQSATPTPTPTPSTSGIAPSATPTPTPTPSQGASQSTTPTPTPTSSQSATPTPTPTSTTTPTPTPSTSVAALTLAGPSTISNLKADTCIQGSPGSLATAFVITATGGTGPYTYSNVSISLSANVPANVTSITISPTTIPSPVTGGFTITVSYPEDCATWAVTGTVTMRVTDDNSVTDDLTIPVNSIQRIEDG